MLILNNQGRTYSAENETVVQAQLRAPTPPPQGLCPRSSAQDIVFHHLSHSPLLTVGY